MLFLSTLSLRRATADTAENILAYLIFLSTLSLRRATSCPWTTPRQAGFLSTLSLRRATRPALDRKALHLEISIHALLAESDHTARRNSSIARISIHALLAESDSKRSIIPRYLWNFYPRSPCGERRLTIMLYDSSALIFLSTLSLRRATVT